MRDMRRITLIARGATAPAREWDASAHAANRIIFVDTFAILKGALGYAAEDVDRLFIDCAATESQFLDLLTTLPGDFIGDVLFVNSDERSFLSTTCLLYAMLPADVRFYLEAQRLVTKESIAA